ncbi:MAG: TIR domain-containing protein [bacterium]
MARYTFFSFHYQRDIFRVNQIRSIPNIIKCSAAGFVDSSIWEKARAKSDEAIYKLIDDGLSGTSITVVLIGYKTAGRKFINYEIEQSLKRGNAVIGVRIHHLIGHEKTADPAGEIPHKLIANNCKIYKYTDVYELGTWIEEAVKAKGNY